MAQSNFERLIEMQEEVLAGNLAAEKLQAEARKFAMTASVEELVGFFKDLCRASPTLTEEDVADMIIAASAAPKLH
jgi:hypothetical protein